MPLGTIGHVRDTLEYGVIWERDRQPTVTVQADVRGEAPSIGVTRDIDAALATVRASLPAGYRIEIGGAAEESMKGQTSINAQMPIMIITVLTLLMIQLKRFSRTFIVVLTAPLGLIGVVAALLLFGKPFGFVALLGVIAMFGIIMRNSVILVDQIEGHRGRASAFRRDRGRNRAPLPADHADRRRSRARADSAAALGLLRPDGHGADGWHHDRDGADHLFLPALYATCFKVRSDERESRAMTVAPSETC